MRTILLVWMKSFSLCYSKNIALCLSCLAPGFQWRSSLRPELTDIFRMGFSIVIMNLLSFSFFSLFLSHPRLRSLKQIFSYPKFSMWPHKLPFSPHESCLCMYVIYLRQQLQNFSAVCGDIGDIKLWTRNIQDPYFGSFQ